MVKKAPAASAAPAAPARNFDTPQQAADALVDAAEKFDVGALVQIFGPGGEDVVFSGEFPQDRQHAANFVAEAHEKKSVSVDPKSGNRAFEPHGLYLTGKHIKHGLCSIVNHS